MLASEDCLEEYSGRGAGGIERGTCLQEKEESSSSETGGSEQRAVETAGEERSGQSLQLQATVSVKEKGSSCAESSRLGGEKRSPTTAEKLCQEISKRGSGERTTLGLLHCNFLMSF